MRGFFLIMVLAGMAYFLFLKKEDVERFDLDEAENKVEQIEAEVERAMQEAQDKLDAALEDN